VDERVGRPICRRALRGRIQEGDPLDTRAVVGQVNGLSVVHTPIRFGLPSRITAKHLSVAAAW
jgi:hypothetical protein